MNYIIISLDTLNINKNIISGIKLFAHRNKKTKIILIGKEKELVLFDNIPNIKKEQVLNEGQDESNYINLCKERTIKMLEENKDSVLISFLNKIELNDYYSKYLKKLFKPFYLVRFLSGLPNRYIFISDAGLNNILNKEDYKIIKDESLKIIDNIFLIKDPKYSLVTTLDETTLNQDEISINNLFKKDNNYLGLSKIENILDGKADLYLTNSYISEGFIQGSSSIYNAYESKFKQYIKDDFFAKISNFFARKMNNYVFSNTSASITRHGLILLGYDKIIIKANENVFVNDIYNTLINANKFITSYSINSVKEKIK